MVTPPDKPIVLLGFMGSGKSTLGRQLATLLNRVFIDIDNFIETRERRSISDIFERDGEAVFRDIEANALREILRYPGQVLAAGGGAPCHRGNMEAIRAAADSVYLKVGTEELCGRLTASPSQRPLLRNKTPEELFAFIGKLVEERETFYLQADHIIESDNITAEMILERINPASGR